MAQKTNATPGNLFGNYTAGKNVSVSPDIHNASAKVGRVVGEQLAGSNQFVGLIVLALFGTVLWKTEASMDQSAVVMVPTVFFLAANNFLPYASGIIDATLLSVASVFAFGILKYMFR